MGNVCVCVCVCVCARARVCVCQRKTKDSQASARTSAELDEACQRKTKDRADGMREKSAHFPRRYSNLYLWDTHPPCFRLHYEGRHASHQSKQTLHTLTRVLHRETITAVHETLQLLYAGPRRQASARTSAESDEACQRKTEDSVCVCVCVCVCV